MLGKLRRGCSAAGRGAIKSRRVVAQGEAANMRSKEMHLLERPQGLPTPGQFGIVEIDVADPGAGELLVENIYMSVDPAMRPRLAAQTPLNAAMIGGAIGRVLKSRHAG